jgi:hypothetical protein
VSLTTILYGYDSAGLGVIGTAPSASLTLTVVTNTIEPSAATTTVGANIGVPSISVYYSTIYYTGARGFTISTSVLPTSTATSFISEVISVPSVFQPPQISSTPNSTQPSSLGSSTISPSNSSVFPPTTPASSVSLAGATQTAKHTHQPQKFSSGDLAGAAVGCLIGGAIIAGLLVWLFMSSRHKKRRSRGGFAEHRPNSRNVNQEKSLPTAPLLGGRAAGGWEQHLPQSESDSTMRTSVKALFDQIELHVENFYRNAAVPISPELQTDLMKVHSSYLPDSVVSLLSQTKTQTQLIKHCLAYLIVSRIAADSDAPASFLPADFVALPRAMGGTRANQDKPGKQHAKRFVTGPVTDNHSICTSSLSLARSILLSPSPCQRRSRLPLHAGYPYRGRS